MTKKKIALYVGLAFIPLLIGGGLALWDVWHQSAYFVSTKDAQVATTVVNVSAPAAGQVADYRVQVGDVVQPGDLLALLNVLGGSAQAGTSGSAAAAVAAAPTRFSMNVRATTAGTVLSKASSLGASVTAGQPLFTIGDLDNVWVVANVDEAQIAKVHPGQTASVYVGALDRTMNGTVDEITPATAAVISNATSSTAARAAVSGAVGAARPIQTIPVRIDVDAESGGPDRAVLYPGMSVEVKIAVR